MREELSETMFQRIFEIFLVRSDPCNEAATNDDDNDITNDPDIMVECDNDQLI